MKKHTFDETQTCFDCGANNMTLIEYIATNFDGNQAAFARAQQVKPPQVSQWIAKGFIVIDHTLYSQRRNLKQN